MKFYVVYRRDAIPKGAKRPFAILTKDNWNDFGYRTLFDLTYHAPGGETIDVGGVKIASLEDNKTTELDDTFTELPETYFSLGQALSYYETIRRIPKKQQHALLTGLRDVVYLPALAAKASHRDVFTTSFLRFSEAVQAYREAGQLFGGEPPTERTACSFRFTIKMKEAGTPHVLSVLLGDNPKLPDRIMALIGKNGTGKTWLLGRLAAALSGQGEVRNVGTFEPERPTFGRVIAVSYSAFDRFNKPEERSFS
jgi:hypothetical protein